MEIYIKYITDNSVVFNLTKKLSDDLEWKTLFDFMFESNKNGFWKYNGNLIPDITVQDFILILQNNGEDVYVSKDAAKSLLEDSARDNQYYHIKVNNNFPPNDFTFHLIK